MSRLSPFKHDQGVGQDGGGTAVLDRPKTLPHVEDWSDKLRKNGRTVSASIRTIAMIGDHQVAGEVEPQFDGAYGRCSIRLRKDGDEMVNANPFNFKASLDWPGPIIGFLVHNGDGKAIAKAECNYPVTVKAGMEIAVEEGKAVFKRLEREDGR